MKTERDIQLPLSLQVPQSLMERLDAERARVTLENGLPTSRTALVRKILNEHLPK